MKTVSEIPYSHEEAERAGGLQPVKARFTDLIYGGKTKMADYHNKNSEDKMKD